MMRARPTSPMPIRTFTTEEPIPVRQPRKREHWRTRRQITLRHPRYISMSIWRDKLPPAERREKTWDDDKKNPEPALRQRPLCGLTILWGWELLVLISWQMA